MAAVALDHIGSGLAPAEQAWCHMMTGQWDEVAALGLPAVEALDEALEHHRVVAEGGLGLALLARPAWAVRGNRQVPVIPRQLHHFPEGFLPPL